MKVNTCYLRMVLILISSFYRYEEYQFTFIHILDHIVVVVVVVIFGKLSISHFCENCFNIMKCLLCIRIMPSFYCYYKIGFSNFNSLEILPPHKKVFIFNVKIFFFNTTRTANLISNGAMFDKRLNCKVDIALCHAKIVCALL